MADHSEKSEVRSVSSIDTNAENNSSETSTNVSSENFMMLFLQK